MQRNYSEAEVLNLMLNKDKFLRYISQQYEDDNNCTQLEPIIWALHFNVPKYQRLPLLENILFRNMAHIRKCYSFLPEVQIYGKTLEALGIPTVCAEPDKCFLNAYKKYKPYYPVRYPKSTINIPVQYENIIDSSIIKKPDLNANTRSFTPPLMNQTRINNSTPIAEKIQSLMINPLMSPIKVPMNDAHYQLANSFFNGGHFLNEQNMTQNSIYHETKPTLLSNILESRNNNNFNVSQQTKCSNTIQEQHIEYFISRDPRNDPREYDLESNNSKSDLNNSRDTWNKEHHKKERKNNCDSDKSNTSVYFYGSKKENYKESKFINLSTQNFEEKIESDLKQNLSNKLEKYLSLQDLKKNSRIRKSTINSSPYFKITKHKTKKSCMKLNTKLKQAFNNSSFLRLDKKSQIKTIKSKLRKNKSNEMEQDSIEIENKNTRTNSMNEISVSHNIKENNKSSMYSLSHINSQTFSDDSVLSNNSQKLYFINLSQESNNETN